MDRICTDDMESPCTGIYNLDFGEPFTKSIASPPVVQANFSELSGQPESLDPFYYLGVSPSELRWET